MEPALIDRIVSALMNTVWFVLFVCVWFFFGGGVVVTQPFIRIKRSWCEEFDGSVRGTAKYSCSQTESGESST